MPSFDVSVTGANDLAQVAGAINRLTPGLRKEYLAAIRKVSRPLINKVKQSAADDLPHGGGLNRFVKDSKLSIRTRTTGKAAGVRIDITKAGHDIKAIDAGTVRHPVFGNRSVWVEQGIRPGFFTNPLTEGAPEVREALVEVMETFLRRIKQESHT